MMTFLIKRFNFLNIFFSFLTILICSCEKNSSEDINLPSLTTSDVTRVLKSTAISGGIITWDGSLLITAHGVCWDTLPDPTYTKQCTNNGNGAGSYISNIANLKPGKKYYLRAYATTDNGTSYGSTMVFTTVADTIKDIDGNKYKTVQIGNQIWMADNLKTSRLNDGTPIKFTTTNNDYTAANDAAYSWYYDNVNNKKLGGLYNFFAIATGKLSPKGWHIPTDNEWNTLINYLGGSSVAGGKMKATGTIYWNSPNNGATNESGFSGIAGGYRYGDGGDSYDILTTGYWWAAPYSSDYANARTLQYNNTIVTTISGADVTGYSVRCIKD